jgi:dolichol-phosphate mannosyltransferase
VDRDIFVNLPFFNHMHRFMPALVRREGGCVIAVPVGHRMRARGQSKYGILDRLLVGISDMLGVIWLLRRMPQTGKVTEDSARKASSKTASTSSSKKSSRTKSSRTKSSRTRKKAGARG